MGPLSAIVTRGTTLAHQHTSPPPRDGSSKVLNTANQHLAERTTAFSTTGTAAKVFVSRAKVAHAMLTGDWFKTSLEQVRNTQETLSSAQQQYLGNNDTQNAAEHGKQTLLALQNNQQQIASMAKDYAHVKAQEDIVKKFVGQFVTACLKALEHSGSRTVRVTGLAARIVWKGTGTAANVTKRANMIELVRQDVDRHLRDTEKGTPGS